MVRMSNSNYGVSGGQGRGPEDLIPAAFTVCVCIVIAILAAAIVWSDG